MMAVYSLCTIYVLFLWSVFVLDNLIFLIMRLLKKEPREKSKYAFSDAFMQRGSDTEIYAALINIVAHIGFVIWVFQVISAITK